jgi:hypothetical protein
VTLLRDRGLVPYLLGVLGAAVLGWIAAAPWLPTPPTPRGFYADGPRWFAAWAWFAPLPYAFAWFAMVGGGAGRAALAIVVLGALGAVTMLFGLLAAALAQALGVMIGCVLVWAIFTVAMAALQDGVPPEQASDWRWTHAQAWLVAMSTFWLAMLPAASAPRGQGLLVALAVPLGAFLAGLTFHAIMCWRMLTEERRQTRLWGHVAALLGGGAGLVVGSWMVAGLVQK